MTSVGGGEFSSPVTVSLREPFTGTSVDPVIVISVTIIVVMSLVMAALCAYICWYVQFACTRLNRIKIITEDNYIASTKVQNPRRPLGIKSQLCHNSDVALGPRQQVIRV